MYLIVIQVPIYVDGERTFVTTEWRRSLILLRDSFEGRFGELVVLAPSLPASERGAAQSLESFSADADGVRLVASFDARARCREYWTKQRARWKGDLRRHVASADVVHSGMDDVFRPIAFQGHVEAVRQGRPTVFVQDTDIVLQIQDRNRDAGARARLSGAAYGFAFDRCNRYGVRTADLALLKGGALMERYAGVARNARAFEDTSYALSDVVGEDALERRLGEMQRGDRPLRLVYCGRLIDRKGIDHSLRIVHEAARLGARVSFDVIGDGPDRQALESLTSELGLASRVRFLGSRVYGPGLLSELAEYDALLFTPLGEDTPRMIFDGYAAGLPTIGYGIRYVRDRVETDGAGAHTPAGDVPACALLLAALDSKRGELARLSRQAMEAGRHHAAESWYRRRAEWTIEAVERRGVRVAQAAAPSPALVVAGEGDDARRLH